VWKKKIHKRGEKTPQHIYALRILKGSVPPKGIEIKKKMRKKKENHLAEAKGQKEPKRASGENRGGLKQRYDEREQKQIAFV